MYSEYVTYIKNNTMGFKITTPYGTIAYMDVSTFETDAIYFSLICFGVITLITAFVVVKMMKK
jgi:hypothetical protein